MDIKPFVSPDINVFGAIEPWGIIVVTVAILAIVVSIKFVEKLPDVVGAVLVLVGVVGLLGGGPVALMDGVVTKQREAYQSRVQQLKDGLSEEGFVIISGTPNLKPNTQSSMLLEYTPSEGKTYDCTLFTPEDVTRNVVFSCGEAKLTLQDIKAFK